MITYIYWIGVLVSGALLFGVCAKIGHLKIGIIVGLTVLGLGWSTYHFRLQQVFVKHYGGVMTIHLDKNLRHIGATWKDDNLWIENYNPTTNTCIFTEYSKGNLLQGRVTLKNCYPINSQTE